MNAGQIYHIGMVVCYVLSGLAFALTVYLFFKYKMLNVFNVLSGRKLKQDMNRLSHLSGSASETEDEDSTVVHVGKKKKKKTQSGTELLYGLDNGNAGGGKNRYGNTEGTQQLFNDEGDNQYDTEGTEELFSFDSGTEELFKSDDGTEELDILLTDALDTELL